MKKEKFSLIIFLIFCFYSFNLSAKSVPVENEIKLLLEEAQIAFNYHEIKESERLLKKISRRSKEKDFIFSDRYESEFLPEIEYLASCILLEANKLEEAKFHIERAIEYQLNNIKFRRKFVEIQSKLQEKISTGSIIDWFNIYDNEAAKSPHYKMGNVYKSLYCYDHNLFDKALSSAVYAIKDIKDYEGLYALDIVRSVFIEAFIKFKHIKNEEYYKKRGYIDFLECLNGLSDKNIYQLLLTKGRAYRHLHIYEDALDTFKFIEESFSLTYHEIYPELVLASKSYDEKMTYIETALRIDPWNEYYWKTFFRLMENIYLESKFDRYNSDITELVRYLDKRIDNKRYYFTKVCKGIISVYNNEYKKAKKYLKNLENITLDEDYNLNLYLFKIYFHLNEIEKAISFMDRGNVSIKKIKSELDDLGYKIHDYRFHKEAAILAYREGEALYYDSFAIKFEELCPNEKEIRGFQREINKMDLTRMKAMDARLDRHEEALVKAAENFFFIDKEFENLKINMNEKYLELIRLNLDLKNRLESNYNELLELVIKNDEKVKKLINNLTVEIQKEKNERIKEKAILLREVLANRDNINFLREELKPRLSDYVNVSFGLGLGPVFIGINVLRIIEDIADLLSG